MRVLHVLDWYRPFGGAERLLFCMLELLESAGHENVVIANEIAGQARTNRRPEYFVPDLEINFAGVPASSLLGRAAWISALQGRVRDVIERHRPDVAHVHNLQNPFVLKAVTAALPTVRSIHDPRLYCFTNWRLLPNRELCPYPLGRRCITEGCLPANPLSFSGAVKQAPYRLLHLRAHRDVDVLIAESRAVRDCLAQNGFPEAQLALLPNMTPLYGTWEEVNAFNVRHAEPGSRTVLFIGRASYEKGIDYLVEAMARVPKPWRLVLVTGGEQLAAVRERVSALGLEDSVEFPGVVGYEEARRYYARADVVAFPSVWIESFGLVGLEAMAHGKPVVAFRTGGIPEWLEDGVTGFFAPLKDVRALAARIRQVLDDPELAGRLGRGGYERVVREFNGELYLERLLAIYGLAAERRRARPTSAARDDLN